MNQPILAPNEIVPPEKLSYPKLASFKLDGNRCIVKNGELLTRNMKPQPNRELYHHFKELCDISIAENLIFDGEIYSPLLEFTELQTYIRTHDKPLPPELQIEYYIFDCLPSPEWNGTKSMKYRERLDILSCIKYPIRNVRPLAQYTVHDADEVAKLFQEALDLGYEGLMLRDPNGLYKNGRCTIKQNNIFKMKEFETVDGRVVSFNPRTVMREGVARERGETGELKRVNRKDDREVADDLGSITVETKDGLHVGIGLGKGTTQEYRRELWRDRGEYIGKWLEFKYMPHGTKDLPRIGTLVRFRPDLD